MATGSLVAAMLLGSAAVTAAELPRGLGPGLKDFTNYKGPKLVGQQLRDCVVLDNEFRSVELEVSIARSKVDAAERQHQYAGERLDELKAALDTADGDAVDRYNEEIHRHARLVREYNDMLPAFNALVGRINDLGDKFNADCAERAYLIRDWNKIDVGLPSGY